MPEEALEELMIAHADGFREEGRGMPGQFDDQELRNADNAGENRPQGNLENRLPAGQHGAVPAGFNVPEDANGDGDTNDEDDEDEDENRADVAVRVQTIFVTFSVLTMQPSQCLYAFCGMCSTGSGVHQRNRLQTKRIITIRSMTTWTSARIVRSHWDICNCAFYVFEARRCSNMYHKMDHAYGCMGDSDIRKSA